MWPASHTLIHGVVWLLQSKNGSISLGLAAGFTKPCLNSRQFREEKILVSKMFTTYNSMHGAYTNEFDSFKN